MALIVGAKNGTTEVFKGCMTVVVICYFGQYTLTVSVDHQIRIDKCVGSITPTQPVQAPVTVAATAAATVTVCCICLLQLLLHPTRLYRQDLVQLICVA
jgi:hypothetical protein